MWQVRQEELQSWHWLLEMYWFGAQGTQVDGEDSSVLWFGAHLRQVEGEDSQVKHVSEHLAVWLS